MGAFVGGTGISITSSSKTLGGDNGILIQTSSVDPDAQAFISYYSITSTTEQNAIIQLVEDSKAAGIWSNMVAIYPRVGGTAFTCGGNLVSPGTFDLTHYGGWTHSATGSLPNGTNAYADTGINTLTHLSSTSFTLGTYLNSALLFNRYHFGVSGGTSNTVISMRNSSSTVKFSYAQTSILPLQKGSLTTTSNQGFWAVSKRSDSDRTMICSDGTFVSNTSAAGLSNPSLNIYIGAHNVTGTASSFDTMSHALDFVASGLTNTQLTDFRTIVIAFQTALSRNV